MYLMYRRRVFEVANELGVDVRTLLDALRSRGEPEVRPEAQLSESLARKVRQTRSVSYVWLAYPKLDQAPCSSGSEIVMIYHFVNLDPVVRELMLDELASDIADQRLYESKRAVSGSRGLYIDLLREAFASSDADTLTNQLASAGIFAAHQSDGKTINVADSAAALGDGQFNAYYARAVCRRAIEEDRAVEIYRGQTTIARRASSEALIGTRPDPVALLNELREHSLEPWKFSSVGKVKQWHHDPTRRLGTSWPQFSYGRRPPRVRFTSNPFHGTSSSQDTPPTEHEQEHSDRDSTGYLSSDGPSAA